MTERDGSGSSRKDGAIEVSAANEMQGASAVKQEISLPFYAQEVEVDFEAVKQEVKSAWARLPDGIVSLGAVALLLSVSVGLWSWMARPSMPQAARPSVSWTPEQSRQIKTGEAVYRKHGLWMDAKLRASARGEGSGLPVSEAWLVAYLADPRSLAGQKSARPQPQLLQRDSGGRAALTSEGKALLAFLQSRSRWEHKDGFTESERVGETSLRVDLEEGRRLYQAKCSSCHGLQGRGDGVLAKNLGLSMVDLASPGAILCRSDRQPQAEDLIRILQRGIPHTGMLPLSRSLTASQIASLSEYLRQIVFLQEDSEVHYALQRPVPQAPVRAQVERSDFQRWAEGRWQEEHRAWYAARPGEPEALQAKLPEWREWMEWQRFNQWVRSDPRRLPVSKADWSAAMMKKFPKSRLSWLSKGRDLPYGVWLEQSLEEKYIQLQPPVLNPDPSAPWYRRSLQRVGLDRPSPIRSQHQRDSWLNSQGFRSYLQWREEEERRIFKRWQEEQTALLFRAWQGREVYRESGCASCHGLEGKGETIQLPTRETAQSEEEKFRMVKVQSFDGPLRCGSSPRDIQRSILAGPHAALLSRSELYRYLRRLPIPPPEAKPYSLADVRFWALVHYIRFLQNDLPSNRPLQRP